MTSVLNLANGYSGTNYVFGGGKEGNSQCSIIKKYAIFIGIAGEGQLSSSNVVIPHTVHRFI